VTTILFSSFLNKDVFSGFIFSKEPGRGRSARPA